MKTSITTPDFTVTFEAINPKRFFFESTTGTLYHGDHPDGSDAVPLEFRATDSDSPEARNVILTLGLRTGSHPLLPE